MPKRRPSPVSTLARNLHYQRRLIRRIRRLIDRGELDIVRGSYLIANLVNSQVRLTLARDSLDNPTPARRPPKKQGNRDPSIPLSILAELCEAYLSLSAPTPPEQANSSSRRQ
jgi:hypothetical protein